MDVPQAKKTEKNIAQPPPPRLDTPNPPHHPTPTPLPAPARPPFPPLPAPPPHPPPPPPQAWEESDPKYISNSDEVKLRPFTTKVHKVDACVSYKAD